MKTNTETIKAIYEAFGQGNVPFILETVAANFTWTDPCNPAIVPHGGSYKGRDGFLDFFQKLGGNADTTLWEVDSYISDGNVVAATGKHNTKVHATGKTAENEWVMVWGFEDGNLVSGRSYYNTANVTNSYL